MRLPLGDCPLLRPCLGQPPPDLVTGLQDLGLLVLLALVFVVLLVGAAGMGRRQD